MTRPARIGIDLGGTKIAGVALGQGNQIIAETRTKTPKNDYRGTVRAIVQLVHELEKKTGQAATVGVGIPGSVHPKTGRIQNANSTWLNGTNMERDLSSELDRPIRLANDADCFAISEAIDGAGRNEQSMFGVILGTGCGGAYIRDKSLPKGPLAIAGEWGHTPLPWPHKSEYPGPLCWCGRRNCMETWVSGPAIEKDHREITGQTLACEDIVDKADKGEASAQETLARHLDRLARGLAVVVNILDPQLIVLGGGLSKLEYLYDRLPEKMLPHIFSDDPAVIVSPPVHGDAGGVRGAAWLWPE